MNTPLRAVGYCRVSMREQVNGYSLEAQETHIRQYVDNQGWQWIGLYTDAGISAKKNSHRPQLEKFMQDAGNDKFDVVVVDKIDRFYRHLAGLLTALDQLNKWDVSFSSVQERLDFATPWGRLTLTVLGMLAEIYLSNLRQETRKGKHQRARDGLWNGNPPYGYCRGLCSNCEDLNGPGYCPNVGQPDRSDGKRLIIHPIDGQVVRQIFAWYATGEASFGKIADWLNDYTVSLPNGERITVRQRGIPGRMKPHGFSRDTIRCQLASHFYTGKVAYRGIDEQGRRNKRKPPAELFQGQHPALIDDEMFEKVQEVKATLSRNCRHKKGQVVRVYPLTGILRCGYCGALFRGSSVHGRCYYRDATRIDRLHDCTQPTLKADKIEAQVLTWLQQVLSRAPSPTMLDELEAGKKLADTRLTRAQELYLMNEIDRQTYDLEKERHQNALKGLHYSGQTANWQW